MGKDKLSHSDKIYVKEKNQTKNFYRISSLVTGDLLQCLCVGGYFYGEDFLDVFDGCIRIVAQTKVEQRKKPI